MSKSHQRERIYIASLTFKMYKNGTTDYETRTFWENLREVKGRINTIKRKMQN